MNKNKVINPIEYKMPEAFAKQLLKKRQDDETKTRPQEYLCDYVNREFGIKGTCVKVIYF